VGPSGPVVTAAGGRTLHAWRWTGAGWVESDLPLPGPARAVAVTTVGRVHDRVLAVAWLGVAPSTGSLFTATMGADGAWGATSNAELGAPQADAAVRKQPRQVPLAEIERRAARLARIRWGIAIAAFPLMVLLAWLIRRR
jgi:hypothetical protein